MSSTNAAALEHLREAIRHLEAAEAAAMCAAAALAYIMEGRA